MHSKCLTKAHMSSSGSMCLPYKSSLAQRTLLDVQYIVLGEHRAAVSIVARALRKGDEAVHLSREGHGPAQPGHQVSQPLDELRADASLCRQHSFHEPIACWAAYKRAPRQQAPLPGHQVPLGYLWSTTYVLQDKVLVRSTSSCHSLLRAPFHKAFASINTI
jgi:hypothetical protein